jgi:hypothetical protein
MVETALGLTTRWLLIQPLTSFTSGSAAFVVAAASVNCLIGRGQ